MRTLARPIGLGLAARGDVEEVVLWARQARDQGLDSVWVHDSYFERDGVTFATAIAQAIALDDDGDEAGFRVALGAANPFTRHPVVLAMTGSALDEILPGRFVLGLGTGLPLRLKQMGIPYEPDAAVEGVSKAMDQIRALWAGERLAVRHAGPAPDPADVPADASDPDRRRRVSQGVRRAGRPEGRRLPRPPGGVDPVAARHPRAAARVGGGRRPRPARDRVRGVPALARRQDAPRGAQPGQARAVRDLHDVGPVRRVAAPRRVRPGAPRPDRHRVAGRGLHDRGQPHPRRAARRLHAVRHARGRRRRRDGVPRARPGSSCRCSSRSSRRTARSTS